jgi:hypothetical protein
MIKTVASIGLAAVIALTPAVGLAQTGASSSWGSYGLGEQIPTQSLTPRDRKWNFDHEAVNQAVADRNGSGNILGRANMGCEPAGQGSPIPPS